MESSEGLRGGVNGEARQNDQRAEEESVHAEHLFAFAVDDGKREQKRRADACEDRACQPPGNTELPSQVRLPDAQHHKSNELEQQAAAVKHDIERHQAFEAQPEAQCPARCADQNCDPGGSSLGVHSGEHARQHAILGHRQRQAR